MQAMTKRRMENRQAVRKCCLVFLGALWFVLVTSGPVLHDAIQRFVSLMVLMCLVVLSGVSWILFS